MNIQIRESSEAAPQENILERCIRIVRQNLPVKDLAFGNSSEASGNRELARRQVRRAIESERLLQEGDRHLRDIERQRVELGDLLERVRASAESLAGAGDGAERKRTLEAARATLARLRARSAPLLALRSSGSLDPVRAGAFDAGTISDSDVTGKLESLNP